jgi:hypothetical protein
MKIISNAATKIVNTTTITQKTIMAKQNKQHILGIHLFALKYHFLAVPFKTLEEN